MTDTTVEELIGDAADTAYHSILEIWRGVLAPAYEERDARVTPQWANRIVTTFHGINFSDMEDFRKCYFDMVIDMAEILNAEIAEDPECLNVTSPEEDVETNSIRYLNLLITWQTRILHWELSWLTTSPHAAIEIAAMSEVHKMFFGENGILGLLDQINFVFTDEDKELLVSVLEETKRGVEDGQ